MDVISYITDFKCFKPGGRVWIYRAHEEKHEALAQIMGMVHFEATPKDYDLDILKTQLDKLYEAINFSGEYTQISDFFWNVNDTIKNINLSVSEGCKASIGMVLTYKNSYFVFNAGNIRIYKIYGADIKILTTEHNRSEQLIKAGLIGKSQYFDNNLYRELTKYIGMCSEEEMVEISRVDNLNEGVSFVICNEPVYTQIDIEALHKVVSTESQAELSELLEEMVESNEGAMHIIKIDEVSEVKETAGYKKLLLKVGKGLAILMAAIGLIFGAYQLWTYIKTTIIPEKVRSQIEVSNEEKSKENQDQGASIFKEDDDETTDGAIVIDTEVAPTTSANIYIPDLSPSGIDSGTKAAETKATEVPKKEVPKKEEPKKEEVKKEEPKKEEPKKEVTEPESKDSEEKEDYTTYELKAGETLYQVSKKFFGNGNHVKEIMSLNNITDASKLPAGYKLKIPKK